MVREVLLVVDRKNHAVGAAVLKHVDRGGLLARPSVRAHEVERIAVGAHLRVDRLETARVPRIGDIVDDEADRHRLAPAHGLRARVGLEAERLDRRAHLAEGVRPDRVGSVKAA